MKPLYVLGVMALIAGIIGVVLPVLPTTPFVLLAGFCFARTSERSHTWLMKNKLFGPMLRNWECERCVALRSKCLSLVMMAMGGVFSISFMLDSVHTRWGTGLLLLIGAVVVVRLRTCPSLSDLQSSVKPSELSSLDMRRQSSPAN